MTIVKVGPGTTHSDGWLWTRWLIDGTRIEPYYPACLVLDAGEPVASVAGDYGLTVEQVQEAVEFTQRRREAAQRGWQRRRA